MTDQSLLLLLVGLARGAKYKTFLIVLAGYKHL